MARYRLSRPAEVDIENILSFSRDQWGHEAAQRYRDILATAMRMAAADPHGRLTRSRSGILRGLRSFHMRHAKAAAGGKVRNPVQILYYRPVSAGLIEIMRVLHDRMEPGLHLGETP